MAASSALLIRSPHDLLFDYALSSAYKSSWVYDPSLALARDPDIWEVVRRDPVVMSAMDRREKGIVKPWHVEPPRNSKDENDKRLAGICEDALGQIWKFNAARRRLSEAAFLGRVYGHVVFERQTISLDGTGELEWLIPVAIQDIDRRRVHLVADWHKDERGNPYKTIHRELYSTDRERWERITEEFEQTLLEYVYGDTEDRVGHGRGLLEATYFYHYMKTVAIDKINQGIDRWANGVIVAEIDGALKGSTSKTNEDLKTGMKNLLRNMRSEHIAVVQKGDSINVVETSGAGHEISMNFVRYLDEGIERLYNGSILPSGHAADAGSKARASVEEDTSEAFYQDEREDLDEIIDRQLLKRFFDLPLNRANFMRLGLVEARRPRFHTKQTKKEDPREAAEVMGSALDRGIPIIEEEYYRRIGCSVPGPSDRVIAGRSQMMMDPMAGGFGGGGGFGANGNGSNSGNGKPQFGVKGEAEDREGRASAEADQSDERQARQ